MSGVQTLVQSWTGDVVALLLILITGTGYYLCHRRARSAGGVGRHQAWCFGAGLVWWLLATHSVIAVYTPVLFWVRALQVLLLLYVVPFLLAMGQPVTVLREASGPNVRARLDAMLGSRVARVVLSPPVTSVLMLATPWLLYLTPWYVASMVNPVIADLTRIALSAIGFCYFYTRLQADPVPRRYSPLLSIGISVAEGLGDGILGLVLWLGPLIAYDYYSALHRDWGPSLRDDQTLGAGVLWILGDVLGVPFIMVLMRALGSHERRHAAEVDAEIDAELGAPDDVGAHADDEAGHATLWWEKDPQLQDRFHPPKRR
ncbi:MULTISPECIES: cytochrome c oxidase assembly protein [unclassified Mycolicibacterium]|uniref:cytochrome c oxidase assembly protein n=1 Tax=unclassified Mycolicibacterium TaxID=2636767 RepID=UPI0028168C7F|nr:MULTISPECIES: cytochrome c oxidase assembly protein [unclassified Mycolicibacterium]